MPRNPRKKRSLGEIHDLIRKLNRSKLTVAQFAKHEGVSVGSIYQWKRKVKVQLDIEPANTQIPAPVEVIAPPQLWSQSQMPVNDSGVHLTLPGGMGCRIEPGFHPETLIQVIELLNKAAL